MSKHLTFEKLTLIIPAIYLAIVVYDYISGARALPYSAFTLLRIVVFASCKSAWIITTTSVGVVIGSMKKLDGNMNDTSATLMTNAQKKRRQYFIFYVVEIMIKA